MNISDFVYIGFNLGINSLTYDKTFSRHTLNVLAGFHGEKYTWEQFLASRKGFPSNEVTDLKGGETAGQTTDGYTRALNMNSFFGRIKYNYDDRYLIEANVRADGTSRFAPGYRWGVFPSFSAAWRISNELCRSNHAKHGWTAAVAVYT